MSCPMTGHIGSSNYFVFHEANVLESYPHNLLTTIPIKIQLSDFNRLAYCVQLVECGFGSLK